MIKAEINQMLSLFAKAIEFMHVQVMTLFVVDTVARKLCHCPCKSQEFKISSGRGG